MVLDIMGLFFTIFLFLVFYIDIGDKALFMEFHRYFRVHFHISKTLVKPTCLS